MEAEADVGKPKDPFNPTLGLEDIVEKDHEEMTKYRAIMAEKDKEKGKEKEKKKVLYTDEELMAILG